MWFKPWFKSLIYSLFTNNINFKSAKEKAENIYKWCESNKTIYFIILPVIQIYRNNQASFQNQKANKHNINEFRKISL